MPALPEICLVASDAALRAAVAEQLALAAVGSVRESAALPASPGNAAALIIDAPLAEKSEKILRTWQQNGNRPKIFILGDGALEEELLVEAFAKPLRLGHLMARLQFYLQMAAHVAPAPLVFGGWRLEPQSRQAVMQESGAVIRLTEKETELLEYLGRRQGPVSREELLGAIWGYDSSIDTHTLETHIYRLRRKLDPTGEGLSPIVAEEGAYRLASGGA